MFVQDERIQEDQDTHSVSVGTGGTTDIDIGVV